MNYLIDGFESDDRGSSFTPLIPTVVVLLLITLTDSIITSNYNFYYVKKLCQISWKKVKKLIDYLFVSLELAYSENDWCTKHENLRESTDFSYLS